MKGVWFNFFVIIYLCSIDTRVEGIFGLWNCVQLLY